ncbi:MAG: MFS transporter [Pseudomonadota bacterium]
MTPPAWASSRAGPLPYWRLSAFYGLYFASLGVLVPYWGPFLDAQGFDALAIGQLTAIPMATKCVAPYLWGWLGDHLGSRMPIARLASFLSALAFLTVFQAKGFWPLAVVMVGFSFFWNASLPQVEVVTFNHLGANGHRYTQIRVWGSVGFIVTVLLLGRLLEQFGTLATPVAMMVLLLGIGIATLAVPEGPDCPADPGHPTSLRRVLGTPEVWAFLVACFLMQVGHGAYYAFYSIYLQDHGYSPSQVGGLWALGVIAEVGLFLVMGPLIQRFGAPRIFRWSLMAAVVRWLVIGALPDCPGCLIGAQILHAATFGGFHASAIQRINGYFPGRFRGRGQALYTSASYGAGGGIGSLAAGALWDLQGPFVTFYLASLVTLVGLAFAWVGSKKPPLAR